MSDLETVARWLGAEYRAHNDAGQLQRNTATEWKDACGFTHIEARWIYLDPDQELGAILRRAAELDHEPSLTYRGVAGWRCAMHHHTDGMVIEHGPTPLAAARAAVVAFVEGSNG